MSYLDDCNFCTYSRVSKIVNPNISAFLSLPENIYIVIEKFHRRKLGEDILSPTFFLIDICKIQLLQDERLIFL